MSKNSATIRPRLAITSLALSRCQPSDDSGSWYSSVNTRPYNANRTLPPARSRQGACRAPRRPRRAPELMMERLGPWFRWLMLSFR
jgi:hypothetical protein